MPDRRSSIDARVERLARDMAQRVSRRSFIGSVGALMFGAASVPLLPVARGESPARASPGTGADPGDPQTCEYWRSEEHTSELQSLRHLVCRLLLEKKKKITTTTMG